jgi:hypothetical protein
MIQYFSLTTKQYQPQKPSAEQLQLRPYLDPLVDSSYLANSKKLILAVAWTQHPGHLGGLH